MAAVLVRSFPAGGRAAGAAPNAGGLAAAAAAIAGASASERRL